MHFCIDNAKKIVEDDQKHKQETAEFPAISLDYYRIFPNKSPRPNSNPVLIEARASIR